MSRVPPMFTPTAEQRAIAEAVARLRPGQLLKVQARAGTGKTSTLEYLAYADARPMLYLAYNADIAAAAKKRFPDTVTVKTTHGLAWSALGIHEWIPEKGAPRNVRSWEIERWLHRRRGNPSLKTGASLADVAADVVATVRAFLHSADPALTVAHAWGRQRLTQREAFLERARQDNPEQTDIASRDGHAAYARYQVWLVAQGEALWQAMIDRWSFSEVDRDTRETVHRNPPKSHGNRPRSDATPAGYTPCRTLNRKRLKRPLRFV